jgi:type IV pilus assembly protein PilM
MFGFGAKPIVGLDIGSSAIKLVEVEKKRSGWVVRSFSSVTLPEDTIVDGEIVNQAAVVESIKTLLKEAGPRSKVVCTSVAGASVIIKHISIPKTNPKELEDQVYWEAEQYIPFDMKDISLDYEVVAEDSGDGKMDILLVAAKKDFIDKRLSTVKESGLEPQILDIDVLALANVFWENYEMTPDNAVVLVDVGASLTKINIVSHNTTIFTRDVAIGGKNLTQEIQNKLGISFQEAEVLKIDACSTGAPARDVDLRERGARDPPVSRFLRRESRTAAGHRRVSVRWCQPDPGPFEHAHGSARPRGRVPQSLQQSGLLGPAIQRGIRRRHQLERRRTPRPRAEKRGVSGP